MGARARIPPRDLTVSTTEILVLAAAVTLVYVTAVWLLSLVLRNASIIDIGWGLGFVLLGTLYHVALDGWGGRRVLVATLVLLWGLRLSGYLSGAIGERARTFATSGGVRRIPRTSGGRATSASSSSRASPSG